MKKWDTDTGVQLGSYDTLTLVQQTNEKGWLAWKINKTDQKYIKIYQEKILSKILNN